MIDRRTIDTARALFTLRMATKGAKFLLHNDMQDYPDLNENNPNIYSLEMWITDKEIYQNFGVRCRHKIL